MSDNNKLLNAQEVSVLVGSSVQTIKSWYKWNIRRETSKSI